MATAVITNIRAAWLISHKAPLILNFFFENTYAAIIVIITFKITVRTVTISEFKKYLDIGIPVAPAKLNRFLKLSNVGL